MGLLSARMGGWEDDYWEREVGGYIKPQPVCVFCEDKGGDVLVQRGIMLEPCCRLSTATPRPVA